MWPAACSPPAAPARRGRAAPRCSSSSPASPSQGAPPAGWPRRAPGPPGGSRRMGPGRNKMLLELAGEPLVRRAARRALAAGLSPVVVVLGHEADRARAALAGLPVEITVNPDFTGPTSGSLHAGLDVLGADVEAVVVLLADMVHVTAAALAELVTRTRSSGAPLVVSRYGDVTAPPLLFRRSAT